ncbi:beta-casein [Dugong dugon]
MKVLIFACLVALALAREKEDIVSTKSVENLSSSEESVTRIDKQKSERVRPEEQQREGECQDKIHPVFQLQPLVYPYAEPISYTVLPSSAMPPAQPVVMLPFLQPEIMELPEAKETIFPRHKVMSFLKSPIISPFDPQILYLTNPENLHLPLPLLQPLRHQLQQPLAQTPVLPSLSLPKILPVPQEGIPYAQRDTPIQEPLLDPVRVFHPVAQPLAPVYNPVAVS